MRNMENDKNHTVEHMEVLKKLNTFQAQYEIEPPYPYIELMKQGGKDVT